MAAQVIDGKAAAERVRAEVRAEVETLTSAGGEAPGLATVLVGEDPASQVYVANKHRACEEAGIRSIGHELDTQTSQSELLDLIAELNDDASVDGILVQLPLPERLVADTVLDALDPAKDVDGLTPTNAGRLATGRPGLVPCTPAGVMELLDDAGTELRGAEAVVVGRSALVGRPVAALLLARHATVTTAHSRTGDLAAVCRRADVLVAAAGVQRLIGAEMVKPGATVIDVGIHRTEEGLVGDVDFAAVREVAGAITPVPGGVGPMTIAMLLRNTLTAAQGRRDAQPAGV